MVNKINEKSVLVNILWRSCEFFYWLKYFFLLFYKIRV